MSEPLPMSDADIIRLSFHEPQRFALLADAHCDAVARYLNRRVGNMLAQDLTSETFLLAFRGRFTYDCAHTSALPWLYGIATNQIRNHFRSEQRRIAVLGQMAGQAILADAGQDRVDESLTAAAELQQVAGGFAALSDDARDVLVLIAVEGLTYVEVAAALGVPVGTVRSRLSRARRDLRRCLSGTEPFGYPSDPKHDRAEGTCYG